MDHLIGVLILGILIKNFPYYNFKQNEMTLPNSTAHDVADGTVEEITTNPVVTFSSSKEDELEDLPARPPTGYDRFRRRQSIMNPTPYKKPTSAKSDKGGAGDPEAIPGKMKTNWFGMQVQSRKNRMINKIVMHKFPCYWIERSKML